MIMKDEYDGLVTMSLPLVLCSPHLFRLSVGSEWTVDERIPLVRRLEMLLSMGVCTAKNSPDVG